MGVKFPWQKNDETGATAAEAGHEADAADAHGASKSQVALAWLLARPAVTSVILGARTVSQLQDNLGAADLVLEDAELTALTDASAPRVDDYPYGTAGVAQRVRKISGGR